MLERISTDIHWLQTAALIDLDFSSVFVAALFLLLLFLLNGRFMQPMLDVFDKRHALTDGAKQAAREALAAAESRIEEYEARVGETRRAAVARQKALRDEGIAREKEMLDGVRQDIDGEVDAGLADLRKTADEARAGLRARADELGRLVARKVMGGGAS